MAAVPTEIPGIGATTLRLLPNPMFNPVEATPTLTSQDFYVLSRFDGATTLKDLILMTGFPTEESVAIILKLRQMMAILLPGEKPVSPQAPVASRATTGPVVPRASTGPAVPRAPTSPVVPRASTAPVVSRTPTAKGVTVGGGGADPRHRVEVSPTSTPTAPPAANFDTPTLRGADGDKAAMASTYASPISPASLARAAAVVSMPPPMTTPAPVQEPIPDSGGAPWTGEELAALLEPTELTMAQRALILRHLRLVTSGDRFAMLGVAPGTSKQDIKRAFFKLSKELHPDRYYGKRLGSFAAHLSLVFTAISKAYEEPMPKPSNAAGQGSSPGSAQSASEHAAELFERACQSEISGDLSGALNLFRAAIRLAPLAKYLRRGAMCALTAAEIPTAEEFARKGVAVDPMDISMQRLLAQAFREAGKLAEAEEVLVMAMAMRSENDVLGGELRNDLAVVRRLLNQ